MQFCRAASTITIEINSTMPSINPKIGILAVAVTAITACGAWVGANLEESQKVKKIQEESLSLKISRYRKSKSRLHLRCIK